MYLDKQGISTFTTCVVLLSSISKAFGNLYTISDDRIRSMDITPVLGRGYSIMTNQYHSTCLTVDETSVPSYNYDYYYTDIFTSSSSELSGKVSSSFGNGDVKYAYSRSVSTSSKSETKTRLLVTTMSIERYYSSVREEVSPLNSSAAALLQNEDYVGFFKACGPNYVRSIRRRQEVTAILRFTSTSVESARQYSSGVKVAWGYSNKSSSKSSSSSLTISIKGYGMGLTAEGSDTLVASSIPDYRAAMKFAFNSFTKNKDAAHVGMIYGIEVVPWVYNTEFQVAAALGEEPILTPMPRTLIPKAPCKNTGFKTDKYNSCCEVDQLFKDGEYVDVNTYTGTGSDATCKPLRQIDPNVVKDNLSNNGEFVARMDAAMRYRFTQLAVLEKCVSAVNTIPDDLFMRKLRPKPSHAAQNVVDFSVSLLDLKLAVDPTGDYGLVSHYAKELDEWIEMFYAPCYAAMFGSNVGTSPDVDVSYFQAYPWHAHDECMKHITCLTTTLRWDRSLGGCVTGMMTGDTATKYPADDTTAGKCTKAETNGAAATESCKYTSKSLKGFQDKANICWKGNPRINNIQYMVANFCMPQVTTTSLSIAASFVTTYKECRPNSL